jgi:AcrR family transcriptional regulator
VVSVFIVDGFSVRRNVARDSRMRIIIRIRNSRLRETMPRRRAVVVNPRKLPKQARSSELVRAILEAAVRVLRRDGAAGFTTSRVAEQAGVSVGSLYQYFPNKQAILFRLQAEEWATTADLLDGILSDERLAAPERLRAAMRAFFRSEYDEVSLRRALGDAEQLYRDAPQAQEQRERGYPLLLRLLEATAPKLTARRRAFAAELYVALFSALGKHVSETARSPDEVDAWAVASADMFLAYLRETERRRR